MQRSPFMSVLALMVACGLAQTAPAQSLPDGRMLERMVFAPDAPLESLVYPHPALSQAEITLLGDAMRTGLLPQMAYYGALAIAPDAGLADATTTKAVGNFHDEVAARAAALATCDAARGDVGSPCTVVLVVRPRGWQPGAEVQLSARASAALREDYQSIRGPRAMAISRASGGWGIGTDDASALAECGQDDCRVVARD